MWFEKLPDQCPPVSANILNGEFYRLVDKEGVACKDFWSHRKIWPNKPFNVDECRARSLSIFDNYDDCAKLTKLPLHKGKKIAKVIIGKSCGVAKQTGREKSHYSWWRSASFNPLEQSSVAV